MNSIKDEVNFSRIRYANCWEDAAMLLHSLRIQPHDRILIIASAGDNALATLSQQPASVRAVDLSLQQLYLCELKQTAFAQLDYDEVLLLLRINAGRPHESSQLYQKLRRSLGAGARDYWDERPALFEAGIMHQGKFEQYFSLFRQYLLPLVHSKSTTLRLLSSKSDVEQARFYKYHWNSWRWKLLMSIFFSKAVMGRYGRDPQFLKHVTLNVPQYIREKSEAALQKVEATRNPFLHLMLTGSYGDHLPVYLQEPLFDSIKSNIGRLHLAQGDMDTEVLESPYDIYCASNIFEYMSAATFESLARRWGNVVPSGARIAFWNLMAPRSFGETAPDQWRNLPTDGADAGFFYSRFLLEERR